MARRDYSHIRGVNLLQSGDLRQVLFVKQQKISKYCSNDRLQSPERMASFWMRNFACGVLLSSSRDFFMNEGEWDEREMWKVRMLSCKGAY